MLGCNPRACLFEYCPTEFKKVISIPPNTLHFIKSIALIGYALKIT